MKKQWWEYCGTIGGGAFVVGLTLSNMIKNFFWSNVALISFISISILSSGIYFFMKAKNEP